VSRGSKERRHYIRLGAETVEARGRELEELIRRKGKTPFDDRPAPRFVVADLRSGLLREYLRETESRLFNEPDDAEVYRRLRLTSRTNGREVPRNVALMFFSDDPERAFPGSRIEFAQYGDGGDLLDEQTFRGPVHQQLRDCVRSLKGRVSQRVEKVPGQAESRTWVSYPFAAIEEAVGNAVHHRDYQSNEPTKILLHQDRLEIVSYPGPVPGLEREHFDAGMTPPIPSRNRRVGELLKELRLVETRYTGLARIHSAMAENGSPPPRFDFDRDRTYFRVILPIHPGAVVPVSEPRSVERGEGLVLISVGAESLRPVVEASLPDLDLGGARVLIDLVAAEYLDADPESLEAEAKRIRNALREPLEEPDVTRLHLFYRGPLAMGPLLGAMFAAAAKPVVVYHYHDGRYTRAYVLDRRFLKAKD
jgi:predicted HTH transcriptional regulator